MVASAHIIEIYSKFVDGATKPMNIMTKSVQSVGGAMERVTTTTAQLNQKTGAYGNVIKTVQDRQKKFQMQWLSLLFFGMAMKRMFSGLIKTSLEWVGLTELMSTTLGVLFLPVAMDLLNILLPIMDWFMNMPESMQRVLGWFVVGGIVVGTFLMTVGQIALGLAGIAWLASGQSAAGKFLSGLGTKLKGANIAKYMKTGGAIIAVGWAIKDLQEGQVTAAIGMATLGLGIYTGNPYLIGIGIALKLVGDQEFLEDIISYMFSITDIAFRIGEELGKALIAGMLPGIKYTPPADFEEALLKGYGKFKGSGGPKSSTIDYIDKNFGLNKVSNIESMGSPVTSDNAQGLLTQMSGGGVSINNTFTISGVSSPDDVKKAIDESLNNVTTQIRSSI